MQEMHNAQQMAAGANGGFAFPPVPSAAAGAAAAPPGPKDGHLVNMQRRVVYGGVLSRLRALMINRMAKPEVGAGGRREGGLVGVGLAACGSGLPEHVVCWRAAATLGVQLKRHWPCFQTSHEINACACRAHPILPASSTNATTAGSPVRACP